MLKITRRLFVSSFVMIAVFGNSALTQPRVLVTPETSEFQVTFVLSRYKLAMESRSLDLLAEVMDPALLIYEGLHKNSSWADYRDNHIKEHFEEWKEFHIQDPKITEIFVSGDFAYAVQEATTRIVPIEGAEKINDTVQTFILRKQDQLWRIKHINSFSKRRTP